MTREEREKAIDLLDNLLGMIEDNQGNDYDFALKMGIEALKQEPKASKDIHLPLYKVGDRIEPGTDGYAYKFYMSNGKEFEKQLCEDAISREAVLDLVNSNWEYEGLEVPIDCLPSVTPTVRWVPIVEGPPKERDWYLGIFKEPDTGWINPIPYICDYVGHKTKATTKEYWILAGYTDRDTHYTDKEKQMDYYFNLECVAWLPLPEAYKAESEEE